MVVDSGKTHGLVYRNSFRFANSATRKANLERNSKCTFHESACGEVFASRLAQQGCVRKALDSCLLSQTTVNGSWSQEVTCSQAYQDDKCKG
eukprot:5360214-Amphidinium_carterae.1